MSKLSHIKTRVNLYMSKLEYHIIINKSIKKVQIIIIYTIFQILCIYIHYFL